MNTVTQAHAVEWARETVRRLNSPHQLWAAQVVSWLDLVDLCRELDDGLILVERPSLPALDLHAAVLALAIGCGQWLIHQIQVERADISASGHSFEALNASLELLRIFQRSRHSGLPSDQIESVRQRIFHAAA